MGKFKETKSEAFEGAFAVESATGSSFSQPTFVGLMDVIRGLANLYDLEKSSITQEHSAIPDVEEYNPNQLYLFGA